MKEGFTHALTSISKKIGLSFPITIGPYTLNKSQHAKLRLNPLMRFGYTKENLECMILEG